MNTHISEAFPVVLLSSVTYTMTLLYAPQPPYHRISLTPRIVMPVRIESSPIWSVWSVGQELRHNRFQLFEEDQILWPLCFALVNINSNIRLSLQCSFCVLHVLLHPDSWICVKLICFIHVCRSCLEGDVKRWFARQCSCVNLRKDQVASPRCTVTGHHKHDCGVR